MARLTSDVAVDYANQVMSVVQQLRSIRTAVAEIVKVNGDNPLGNLWTTLHTTAVAADGQLGTADGSVTAANPIDPRVYPNLTRAAKSGNLTDALQILVDFQTFMNGTAVGANAARPAQVNAVSE